MTQHPTMTMAGILGSIGLAGCGLNGQLNATPAGYDSSQVSGTAHARGASSVSPSSPLQSPAGTSPIRASLARSEQTMTTSTSP